MSANVQDPRASTSAACPLSPEHGHSGQRLRRGGQTLESARLATLKEFYAATGLRTSSSAGPAGGYTMEGSKGAPHRRNPASDNFYRSFEQICRRALARTLRKNGGPITHKLVPHVYIVAPGREEAEEERALLRAAHVRGGTALLCGSSSRATAADANKK